MKLPFFCVSIIGIVIFALGLVIGSSKIAPFLEIQAAKQSVSKTELQWDLTAEQDVNPEFGLINTSTYSEEVDTVYSFAARQHAPLVVSLHTWSGNYLQPDPLASWLVKSGFNYLHPNFQGPNNTENGCLSVKVINDIDSAIDWSIENGSVDSDAIYVVGVSGGGYTALGYASLSRHKIKHTYAWAPITDLHKWYLQSRNRSSKYANDILGCIKSSEPDSDRLAEKSPINMPPLRSNKVSLYAGVEDGYNGPVPISHSIEYFNKFAKEEDSVSVEEAIDFLTKAYVPSGKTIGNRQIILQRDSGRVALTIFDGGHEMLEDVAVYEILSSTSSN